MRQPGLDKVCREAIRRADTPPSLPSRSQNQRAFQKQDNIFVGKKRVLGSKKPGIRETRYYKSIGLGIKTPRTAIEGTYVDKKCPWTGARPRLAQTRALGGRRCSSRGGAERQLRRRRLK